jgi:hypothetical protein
MGWQYDAGVSGTVTLPAGAVVRSIRAESQNAAGAVVIFGGDSIPLDGDPTANILSLSFDHGQCVAEGTVTIVFTNTVSYFVEFIT